MDGGPCGMRVWGWTVRADQWWVLVLGACVGYLGGMGSILTLAVSIVALVALINYIFAVADRARR